MIEPPSTDERAEENLSQQVSRDLTEATGPRLGGGKEKENDHEYLIVKSGYHKFMVIIVYNIVLYTFAKRVDLKSSQYKKNGNYVK